MKRYTERHVKNSIFLSFLHTKRLKSLKSSSFLRNCSDHFFLMRNKAEDHSTINVESRCAPLSPSYIKYFFSLQPPEIQGALLIFWFNCHLRTRTAFGSTFENQLVLGSTSIQFKIGERQEIACWLYFYYADNWIQSHLFMPEWGWVFFNNCRVHQHVSGTLHFQLHVFMSDFRHSVGVGRCE